MSDGGRMDEVVLTMVGRGRIVESDEPKGFDFDSAPKCPPQLNPIRPMRGWSPEAEGDPSGDHRNREDSIQSPHTLRGESKSNPILNIVPIHDLAPSEPPEWVWEGIIARGYCTLLSSYPKCGKTTLLAHLLRDLSRGEGLVSSRFGPPVLVVSEEGAGHWSRRRDNIGIGKNVHILVRPFKSKPTTDQWRELVDVVAEQVTAEGYGFVVIDTLPNLWPVMEENDAGAVTTALGPLGDITDAGAGLLLTHHARKGGGNEGQAARGSGALTGFPDIIAELRRYKSDDLSDSMRIVTAMGRFEECPDDLVIELGAEGYTVVGNRSDASGRDVVDAVLQAISGAKAPMKAEEIKEAIEEDVRVGLSKLRGILNCPTNLDERWERMGTGNRGDAHRYVRAGEMKDSA